MHVLMYGKYGKRMLSQIYYFIDLISCLWITRGSTNSTRLQTMSMRPGRKSREHLNSFKWVPLFFRGQITLETNPTIPALTAISQTPLLQKFRDKYLKKLV